MCAEKITKPFDIPILFLVFNRPGVTSEVFSVIEKQKPKKLYVASDGARKNNTQESKNVELVRKITTTIDWDCDLKTLFRENNLGCKLAVSSAIDWFFENEEAGIILEDDCLPGDSFFRYCEELLIKYRDNKEIMAIGGVNFQFGNNTTDYSYYFSRYAHIWGWATWRRAWQLYDVQISQWPDAREKQFLKAFLQNTKSVKYWERVFENTYAGKIDTWDYQWLLAGWLNGGLNITPSVNLVSNIGVGAEATHTKKPSKLSSLPNRQINFPLKHPSSVVRHIKADNYSQKTLYTKNNIFIRIFRRLFS